MGHARGAIKIGGRGRLLELLGHVRAIVEGLRLLIANLAAVCAVHVEALYVTSPLRLV